MKSHLSYWKYRAVIEPRISVSERFHYMLRGYVTPKGTIHINYSPTTVIVTTLCAFSSLDAGFFERYTEYGLYVYQEIVKSNTSTSTEIISSVEWSFEHEEERISDFLQQVDGERAIFSSKINKIIRTLVRVNEDSLL